MKPARQQPHGGTSHSTGQFQRTWRAVLLARPWLEYARAHSLNMTSAGVSCAPAKQRGVQQGATHCEHKLSDAKKNREGTNVNTCVHLSAKRERESQNSIANSYRMIFS